MAKEVTLVLNVDVNKSMNSLMGIKQEMRKVQQAMEEAASSGNQAAYEQLSQRFIELRENAEDLSEALQPVDKQIGKVTRTMGGLVNLGSGLATVFGADQKSAEQLFKTFAKAQALGQVVNGFNELVAEGPKVVTAFKSIGMAMKTAFLANPVTAVIVAVVALTAAIGGAILASQDFYDAEAAWSERALKNIEVLKKATEEYASFMESYNKKIEDFNDRNLTAGEKEAKQYNKKIEAIKEVAKQSIIELQIKEKQLATSIAQAKADAEVLRWVSPDKYAVVLKTISDLEQRHTDVVNALYKGVEEYKNINKVQAENTKNIIKSIDYIDKENKKRNETTKTIRKQKEELTEFDKFYKKLEEDRKKQIENIPEDPTVFTGYQGLMAPSDFNDILLEQVEMERKTAEERLEIEKKLTEERIALEWEAAFAVGQAISSIGSIMGEETRRGAIMQRAGAIFQLGVDTAKAIGAATSASAANPLNAVTFGGAGIAQYAIMLATILANIAQAKAILSQPLPEFAFGGLVPGAGSQDSVTAKLMPGEGVLNKSAMASIGVNNLNRLNRGEGMIQKVIVTESDITKVQNKMSKVQVRSTIKKIN